MSWRGCSSTWNPESGGQDNEFWLEAWNGSAYTVERMGRPPIALDHLLVKSSADCSLTSLLNRSRGTSEPHVCTAPFLLGQSTRPIDR